jgi:hypothetical protein
MQINNPYPRRTTRLTVNDKDTIICVSRAFLDVPDNATKVVVELVDDQGRGKIFPVGPKSTWTPEWGHLQPEDYDKKVKLAEESAAMEQRKKDDALKRAQETVKVKAMMERKDREVSNRGTPPVVVESFESKLDMGSTLEL